MKDVLPSLWLTLRVSVLAILVLVGPGTWLAHRLARRRLRAQPLWELAVLLPLVLPPTVTGYVLLRLFGRSGLLGAPLEHWLGVSLPFTEAAAVLAAATVALPLYVKTAEAAFAGCPRDLEETARTLGLSPSAVFRRITLPMARRGLASALALSLARAAGEFGATLMFAGQVSGRSSTLALELYGAWLLGDDQRALVLVGLLVALSVGVVLLSGRLAGRAAVLREPQV